MEAARQWLKLEFPSPCGEKVGINPADLSYEAAVEVLFPSPCGEKVGINNRCVPPITKHLDVSVPLRGKGRDQPVKGNTSKIG